MQEIKNNDDQHKKEDPLFWSNDPNVLLNQKYIFEFFPTEIMTYEQKMNAISRLIIVLAIIGFIATYNIRLLIIAIIILTAIFLLYRFQVKEKEKENSRKIYLDNSKEGFEPATIATYNEKNVPLPDSKTVFDEPTPLNPFSNVMLTDYIDNPNKKPAAPANNPLVSKDILGQAKQMVINSNPDFPGIEDKLFRDLGDEFTFEQSLRPFTSNPSTTIPNDQKAFLDFCYGSMVSAKEGNAFALARNLHRHTIT